MPDALVRQAEACEALGSPFMGRQQRMLAATWSEDTPLAEFCRGFDDDIGAGGHSLPLRLAGALHALVLTGRDAKLAAAYPPAAVSDTVFEHEIWRALSQHSGFILDWMISAPQTNEVRRSVVLIPAAHWLSARFGLPFIVSELGASAGLNLAWDLYQLETERGSLGPDDPVLTLSPEWQGDLPPDAGVRVAERRGVDLNPLDPSEPDQTMRLMSYLWPDQPHRQDLTRAAISAKTAPVDRGDAIEWLEHRLATRRDGHLHLIYHTIAWQYFPAERKETGTTLIEAAGQTATEASPLAWLRFEADERSPGAGITLRIWPGDLHISLGRADFHGRWVDWNPQPPG